MSKDRKILVAIIAVAVLAFVYNSGSKSASSTSSSNTSTTTTQNAPSTTSGGSSSLSVYDMPDSIRSQDSWFYDVSDSQIIEVATSVCNALQGGASITDIGEVAAQTIGIEHAPALIAGAIIYICPDQRYKVSSIS